MYQIQDSVPFHPNRCGTKAKATSQVSVRSFNEEREFGRNILIQSRDKSIEELEKRLKWTEGQLKRALESQHFEPDVVLDPDLGGLGTPNSDQPQTGPSYLTSNIQGECFLYPPPLATGESAMDLDIYLPPQKSN
jgi:hypothetical protein